MLRHLLFAVLCFIVPSSGMACPNFQRTGMQTEDLTSRQVRRGLNTEVIAGGRESLLACGYPVRGYVTRVPSLVLNLARLRRIDRLRVRVTSQSCDPVLLLRDASGDWYFDDDSGMGHNASVSIPDPSEGRYAIWVGSYTTDRCAVQLTVEPG